MRSSQDSFKKIEENPFLKEKFKQFFSKKREILEMPTPKPGRNNASFDFKPMTLKQIRVEETLRLKKDYKASLAAVREQHL